MAPILSSFRRRSSADTLRSTLSARDPSRIPRRFHFDGTREFTVATYEPAGVLEHDYRALEVQCRRHNVLRRRIGEEAPQSDDGPRVRLAVAARHADAGEPVAEPLVLASTRLPERGALPVV